MLLSQILLFFKRKNKKEGRMEKKKELPSLLKELRIAVPKEGYAVITIKQKEEDPEVVSILIEQDGKAKSYSYKWFTLPEKDIVIIFNNGSLIEEKSLEEEK